MLPQMKPIFWFWLFILFSLIIVFYTFMNYYIVIYNKNYLKMNTKKNNYLFWKW